MNKKLLLSILACAGAFAAAALGLLRTTTSDPGGSRPYTAGYQPVALEEHANTPPGMSVGR